MIEQCKIGARGGGQTAQRNAEGDLCIDWLGKSDEKFLNRGSFFRLQGKDIGRGGAYPLDPISIENETRCLNRGTPTPEDRASRIAQEHCKGFILFAERVVCAAHEDRRRCLARIQPDAAIPCIRSIHNVAVGR